MEPRRVDRDGSRGFARHGLRRKVRPGRRVRPGTRQCANALLPNHLCIRHIGLLRFAPAACSEGDCDIAALAASIEAGPGAHPTHDAIAGRQSNDPAIRLAASQSRRLRRACLRPAGAGNSRLPVLGTDRRRLDLRVVGFVLFRVQHTNTARHHLGQFLHRIAARSCKSVGEFPRLLDRRSGQASCSDRCASCCQSTMACRQAGSTCGTETRSSFETSRRFCCCDRLPTTLPAFRRTCSFSGCSGGESASKE